MNLLYPRVYYTPAIEEEPAPWAIAISHIKEKYKNRSGASSSSSSTMSDNTSTHSTVSTANTLKGSAVDAKKKKWYSLSSKSKDTLDSETKSIKDSNKVAAEKAVHNDAVASYFSTR